MADPTTSGLNQAGIAALLQQLGLGQYANQASGNSQPLGGPTVGGQPAQFYPGTINVNNAGSQGGFTDQQLMQGLTGGASSNGGNGSGWSTSMTNSGGGSGAGTTLQNDPAWWPKTNSDLNNFYSAQTSFQKNQADSISKLLNGLSNPAPTAPAPPLSDSLNSALPVTAPVINGSGPGYIDPSKAQIPGLNFPTPGSLPSLTTPPSSTLPAAPVASPVMHAPIEVSPALTAQVQSGIAPQSAIIGAGGPLQASASSGIQSGSLPPLSSVPTTQPVMRSYAPPQPLSTTIMPSGIAGQSGYAATSSPVSGGIAASGGQGYLPASANTGAIAGPTVVPGAGGFATDPSTASANQPTASTASTGGMSPQMGSVIAGGIGAIGKSLAPQNIQNPAVGQPINAAMLPPPVRF